MTPPSSQPDYRDSFYVIDVAEIIWARRWRLGVLSMLSMVLGLLVALSLDNAYRSYATIRVENPAPISTGLSNLPILGGGDNAVDTEISILKSRKVLGEVVDRLNLRVTARPDGLPLYRRLPVVGRLFAGQASAPASIRVSRLEMPDTWQGKDISLKYEGGDRFIVVLPDKTRLTGAIGKDLTAATSDGSTPFSLTVTALSGPAGKGFTLRKDRMFETLKWLVRNLEVAQVRRTELVSLSMTDYEASRAQEILAAALEIYARFNHEYAIEKAQRRLDHVEKELPLAMQAIDDAEEALNSFQKETRTINVQVQTEYLLKRLAENEELLRNNQRPTERARLEDIRKEITNTLSEVPDTQIQMQNLQRDIEIAQQIYIGMMKVVQEQRVQRASAYGTVRVLDVPLADELPVGRGRSIIVLAIWGLGTLLASVITVAYANRRRVVQSGRIA